MAASKDKSNENDNNNDESKSSDISPKKLSSLFGGIKNFNKSKLSKTETVVKHIIRVTDYTAYHDEEEIKEHYDDEDTIKEKAAKFASYLKESKHTVFHTGAGVSTAAKLPDYRQYRGIDIYSF